MTIETLEILAERPPRHCYAFLEHEQAEVRPSGVAVASASADDGVPQHQLRSAKALELAPALEAVIVVGRKCRAVGVAAQAAMAAVGEAVTETVVAEQAVATAAAWVAETVEAVSAMAEAAVAMGAALERHKAASHQPANSVFQAARLRQRWRP
jgi:hypothetical protein